jgi:hypothetical protein
VTPRLPAVTPRQAVRALQQCGWELDRTKGSHQVLDRDGEQARADWERWMAEEDAYAEREQPSARADVVLRGDGHLT